MAVFDKHRDTLEHHETMMGTRARPAGRRARSAHRLARAGRPARRLLPQRAVSRASRRWTSRSCSSSSTTRSSWCRARWRNCAAARAGHDSMIETLGHYKILEPHRRRRRWARSTAPATRALGRTVAIKVLPAGHRGRPGAPRAVPRRRARGARPCRIRTSRRSTKSARTTAALFLVFEFVPGETLNAHRSPAGRSTRGAPSTWRTRSPTRSPTRTPPDIVHGDLAADTIIVTPKGSAKIARLRPRRRWTPAARRRAAGSGDRRRARARRHRRARRRCCSRC